jgi:hypothetical protein
MLVEIFYPPEGTFCLFGPAFNVPYRLVHTVEAMRCQRCGTVKRAPARFCSKCGAALPAPQAGQTRLVGCPRCGARNRPTAKFCSRCRAELAARVPVVPIKAHGNRRPLVPIGLVAVPIVILLIAAVLVVQPWRTGGSWMQIPHGAILAQLKQQEAAALASKVIQARYPQLAKTTPSVTQTGKEGRPIYEVMFGAESPVEGGTLSSNATVIIDSTSNKIFIAESD